MKILIVEDDRIIANTLDLLLQSYNYAVDIAADGEAGLQMAETLEYDLILLDILLPKLDGIRLCQQLRVQQIKVPILLLTGQDLAQQKAIALNAGADDYVVKPLDSQELIARIQALLRRGHSNQPILTWEELSLNPSCRKVTYGTNLLSLTPKEYGILELLLRNSQTAFSSTAIIDHVWSTVASPGNEAVRVHIKELRQKLALAGAPKNLIKTVHRVGYCLNPLYSSTLAQQTQQPTIPQMAELADINEELRSTLEELQSTQAELLQKNQELQAARDELEQRVIDRTAELSQREAALRHNQEMFSALVENAPFGVCLVDAEFRLQQINQGAEAAFRNIDPLIGRDFAEITQIIWSEPFATEVIDRFHHTFATGESYYSPVIVEQRANIDEIQSYDWQIHRITLPDGSYGVVCYFYDLSAIKRAEEIIRRTAQRDAFLVTLSDALRPFADPVELQAISTRILGEYLGANRVLYFEICGADYVVERDYVNDATSLSGRYPIDSFSPKVLEAHRAGHTMSVPDVASDTDLSPAQKAAYAEIQIAAHLDIPLVKGGEFVAGLAIHASEPRTWTPDEITLSEEVAERTWAAVERARAEAAVAANLQDTQRLHDLSTRLTTETDIQVLYDEIMATAIALTEADAGTVQILDATTHELVLIASQGFDSTMITHFHRVNAASHTSCGLALTRGERTFVDFDVPEQDDPDGSLQMHVEAGYVCAQSNSLISRTGRQIGMFSTHWREQCRPSDRQLRFLDLLARQAADLIEHRQSELEIRKFVALADNSFEFIGMCDLNFIPFYINELGKQMVGLAELQHFSETPVEEFFFPEDREFIFQEFFPQVLREGKAEVEIRFRHFQTGEALWMIYNLVCIRDQQGEPIALATISRNISDRKQAEVTLQQQIRQEYLLSDIAQDIRQSLDLNEILSRTVHRVREFLNTDRVMIFRFNPDWDGEVIMESVGEAWTSALSTNVFDPCFRDRYIELYRQGRTSMIEDLDHTELARCYVEFLRPFQVKASLIVPILQGEELWGLLIAHHCVAPRQWQAAEVALLQRLATQVGISIQQSELYQSLQTELAERVSAERKVQEQATLLDIASDAIYMRDLEHRILYWNQGAERLYGWTAAEAIGQKADELLQDGDFLSDAMQTLLEQGEWQGELRKVTKSGKEVIVAGRWTLVRNAIGQPKAILTVNTDITEQKNWEAQFYHAQRLESLGTLASGIAHDLNNMLTPILTITQLLRRVKVEPERQSQMLELLEDSVKRGASLVQQILTFARGTPGRQVPMQITDLLREVVKVLQQTFPKAITIHPEIPANGIGLISGDVTQLHQVLMNLCVNARDAMPDGGELGISVQNCIVDERFTQLSLDAHPGDYVMIAITDTGVGIAPEVRDRIFDPFFTTKAVGQGTGLGLSTVLGIVRSHEGFIHVSSDVEQGTQFRVYLPMTQAIVSDQTSVESPLQGNGELILIVDDDLAVQGTNRAVLESYHYQTLVASDGVEAIALYDQRRQDIKLVILDVMMPNMDGISAIRTIRRMNPDVKIIAMSGLSTNQKAVEAVGAAVFLTKPCSVEDLLKTVYDVLHDR